MMELNLQLFGGRGGSSGSNGGGGNTISKAKLNAAAKDYLTHNVTSGSQHATIDGTPKIVSPIDKNGYANVEIPYKLSVRVAVGYNIETGTMEYDNETEYKKDTFRIKVKK